MTKKARIKKKNSNIKITTKKDRLASLGLCDFG